jgi:hypothetical protein
MVQPQSAAGARHGAAARSAISQRATLLDVVTLPPGSFEAHVDVCVVVLEVGQPKESPGWTLMLAVARGVPPVDLGDGPTLVSQAEAVAGFRQHYYGLVGHVHELEDAPVSGWSRPLVTCGSIEIGASAWGVRTTRFAKRSWHRPVVDVDSAAAADPRIGDWFERLRRPKVLVASQTRVTEAVADHDGGWLPGIPAIAVLPGDPADVDRIAALVCAPPVAAWAVRLASGTGMSSNSIRVSSSLLLDIPLPRDQALWEEAARTLAGGDLRAFGPIATEMFRLPPDTTDHVLTWWSASRRRR